MKKIRLVSIHIIFLCLCAFYSLNINAQEYKYEIGGALGTSFYMGDANRTKAYMNAKPTLGVMHRYNISLNWALKSNIILGGVSGDTRDSKNVFPNGNNASFKRTFLELGTQIEYNFFPYSDKFSYLDTRKYTPYIFTGIGVTMASGDNLFFNANIPLGVGFKYKLKEKLNIGVEFSMRKLFGDNFDVTSKDDSWNLDAPFDIKSSIIKNKDWYSLTLFFLSWEFGLKNDPCCGNN